MFIFSSFQAATFENILIMLIAVVMAIFVAMPAHEFAHALAAKLEGDYTAVALKRYTLAPHAHFDIEGFIFLLLFGFGWARPVPVDPRNYKHGRKSQFKVAIAGILTNIVLGILFLFVYLLIFKLSPTFYNSTFYGKLLYEFLNFSISLNFMLAFFNIMPIYPLDGYKIVESFCKYENGFLRVMKKYSTWILLGLIITGLYSYFYTYTAAALIEWLIKIFTKLLGI